MRRAIAFARAPLKALRRFPASRPPRRHRRRRQRRPCGGEHFGPSPKALPRGQAYVPREFIDDTSKHAMPRKSAYWRSLLDSQRSHIRSEVRPADHCALCALPAVLGGARAMCVLRCRAGRRCESASLHVFTLMCAHGREPTVLSLRARRRSCARSPGRGLGAPGAAPARPQPRPSLLSVCPLLCIQTAALSPRCPARAMATWQERRRPGPAVCGPRRPQRRARRCAWLTRPPVAQATNLPAATRASHCPAAAIADLGRLSTLITAGKTWPALAALGVHAGCNRSGCTRVLESGNWSNATNTCVVSGLPPRKC